MARSTSSAVWGSLAVKLISLPSVIHVERVFNPHSQFFFRDVDAGFNGEHRARTERNVIIVGVVDIQADVVTQAVE